MKVLLISHTCQSITEGQPKAHCLAALSGMELRLLTLRWWRHYGAWREAEEPRDAKFVCHIEKARLAWFGPAQNYLHYYPSLARILKEFQPDVIDLWEEPWGLVSAHACWLANKLLPNTRVVAETEQNIDKALPFPFERLRRYTLRNADYAVGRNSEAIGVLRSKGYDGPAEVVPNAVDAELFRPLDREACRRTAGVSGFVAGYFGRLVEEKGLADAVAAIARCPREVNLLLVGSGPFESELKRQAEALGVTDRVRFLPTQRLQDLPPLMNALDVLLLPSRTTERWKEQFGRVVIEAHACGVPVIGSNSGAIPEVIGSAGMIVPERDPAALAVAIRTVAGDPNRARELGRLGRDRVAREFTWGRVAEKMRDIYQRCLDASPKR